MLGLLAAATFAAASTPPAKPFVLADSMRVYRTAPAKPCSDAARLQTSGASPALLYREQDRIRANRLIDLPMAEACLVAGRVAK